MTFGGYVVRDRIGRGGMASVYRAEHRLLEKPVALKVMDPSLLGSDAGLQRFLLEGRAAAAIKHPNVVDITDVGVQDGVPFLVMELLTGEDLDAHLRQHRTLDSAAVVRLALPVVAALHAAHASGVVHRDIKPSNIFLSVGADEQIVPKVLDFGISKMSFTSATLDPRLTPQHQIIGTPQYLPPEALRGASEMGPLSDQFSLGVVLYQCLTGRTPFGGDNLIALLESLSRGSFEPPRSISPDIPPALERIVLRALSFEPRARFPTIRDMGRALIELAAERTQVVWGQSFKTPPPGGTPARGSDHGGRAPSFFNALLTPPIAAQPKRWRRVALGVALLVGGALTPSLLTSSLSRSALSPSAPATAAPATAAPATAAPATAAGGSALTRGLDEATSPSIRAAAVPAVLSAAR
ncbi:MAG TPA: serine/threonine-protein kinase, partial [Polyangiaceae bacterium]|nr:serine/threonine-protein kinase [Polyangiaceae bacterium]